MALYGTSLARRPVLAVGLALLAAALQGCIEAREWTFYATNESDATVILSSDVGSTVVLPPRSYLILGGDRGTLTGDWRIELVDADCTPVQTVTIAEGDQYAVVGPDGYLTHAAAHSVVGQTRVGPAEAPPQTCPRPRDRPYQPSPS